MVKKRRDSTLDKNASADSSRGRAVTKRKQDHAEPQGTDDGIAGEDMTSCFSLIDEDIVEAFQELV